MKRFIAKLNLLLAMSAASAGIVFCLCGFAAALPKGVVINGCDVGGMSRAGAAALVRGKIEEELKEKKLEIRSRETSYVFSFPEISYKDNVRDIVRRAERNRSYTAEVSYYLCGINEIAAGICRNEYRSKVEPYSEFKAMGAPFVYHEGNDGREADPVSLKTDILNSLKGGFEPVYVKYFELKRQTTMNSVKKNTVLLGNFSTVYDASNANRSNNIGLAAALINGVALKSGETFSFNETVGERLPERGFLPAKIIENGAYVEGYGGGVCQVSTTLYNAALLSGMTVTEFHPHSLAVGYVAPSRDAMVSGNSCDLKFKNSSERPVYIRASASDGILNFKIYGKSEGVSYSVESVVVGTVPAPEETCGDPSLAQSGKNGVISEGYLVISRNGYKKRIKLRSDKYLPQKRVIYQSAESPPPPATD